MISSVSILRRVVGVAALVPALAVAQALPDAKELMARHNAAMGNRAVMEAHSSIKIVGTVTMAAMGMEAGLELYKAKPNKLLQKLTLGPMGEMTQGFDGTVAWALPPAGMEPQVMQGEAAEQAKQSADFFSNFQDPANYSKAETLALVDFEGRKCYKVAVTRGTRTATEYFDAGTGLIAGIQTTVEGPMGATETTTIFMEYQDFEGVKFPMKIEQRAGPQVVIMAFKTIEFDKVDPAVFALPEAIKAKVKP